MSCVVKKIGDQEAVITDLAPVEELMQISEGKFDPRELELIRSMDKHQLTYALVEMMGRFRGAQGVVRHLHTEAGQKTVSELRHLRKACDDMGIELWGEWPELAT